RMVRVLNSGEIDRQFELPLVEGKVNAIAFQAAEPSTVRTSSYDNILLGGEFMQVGSFASRNLISLKKNGEIDWLLGVPEGPDGPVRVIRPELDGSILVGGAFKQFSGYPASCVVRLQGLKAIRSENFVYFDRPEFRGYEKLSSIDLSISR